MISTLTSSGMEAVLGAQASGEDQGFDYPSRKLKFKRVKIIITVSKKTLADHKTPIIEGLFFILESYELIPQQLI